MKTQLCECGKHKLHNALASHRLKHNATRCTPDSTLTSTSVIDLIQSEMVARTAR